MPTIDENRAQWDQQYDWISAGNEWSDHWGGTETEWRSTIFPRIWGFVPTGTICEIAPGYGRWSQYLIALCGRYIGVDLSSSCVAACRDRFSNARTATFEMNDGTSLPMINDDSVDFAFSFDSLVHVEHDVISSYLAELKRVLTQDGIAVIHHSNLGQFASESAGERQDWEHWRARSMTAERFAELSLSVGMTCVGQEIINWGSQRLIDCLSVVTRPGCRWDRPNVVVRNENFMPEGQSAQAIAQVFTSLV
jgi:ubiquinone/menaquinone biosynthesis C-methylase UbiE